jgi:hypothetical protein
MNYSRYLCVVLATVGRSDSVQEIDRAAPETKLDDAIAPALQQFLQVVQDFLSEPVTPKRMFEFEGRLKAAALELNRVTLEWTVNHVESSQVDDLPLHVEFDGELHTRVSRQTPHEVSTTFGKICLRRFGYRPTDKSGGPMIFPLEQQLGFRRERHRRWPNGRRTTRPKRAPRSGGRCNG